MSLRRAQRRMVQAFQTRSDAAPDFRFRVGVVTNVNTGAEVTTDGHSSLITVNVRGSLQAMPRLASYGTPAVNDVVAVLLIDKAPLVLGIITGYPA